MFLSSWGLLYREEGTGYSGNTQKSTSLSCVSRCEYFIERDSVGEASWRKLYKQPGKNKLGIVEKCDMVAVHVQGVHAVWKDTVQMRR